MLTTLMRSTFVAAFFSLSISAVAETSANPFTNSQIFVDDQLTLQQAIHRWCSQDTTELPLDQWRKTAATAMVIEAKQLPTFEFLELSLTFVFWPDSKNGLARQMKTLLNTDLNGLQLETLSLSTRSLSAIEYLLLADNPKQHCERLAKISAFQLQQTQALHEIEQAQEKINFGHLMAFNSTVHSAIKQVKEISARKDRIIIQLAPAWRSDSSWQMHMALVNEIQRYMDYFSEQFPALADKFDQQTKIMALPIIEENLFKGDVQTLLAYRAWLEQFPKIIEEDIASELGVFMGFNNYDGD